MEEVIDSLVLATRFDDTGLDRQTQGSLQVLRRFAESVRAISDSIPPITIKTDDSQLKATQDAVRAIAPAVREAQAGLPEFTVFDAAELRAQLQASGADVAGFFAGIRGDIGGASDAVNLLEQAFGSSVGIEETAQDAAAASPALAQLAQRSLEAAAAFRTAGVAEAALNATLERSGFLAEQAARAMLQASAAARTVPATAPLLGPEAPPRIILDKIARLEILAARYREAGAAAQFAARATNAMDVSLLRDAGHRGGGQRPKSEEDSAKAFMVTALSADKAAVAIERSNRSVNLARTGLVSLAAQAVGTSSAIGQLAQSALFFAGGSVAVIATASTILGAIKLVDLLTAKEREAAKAHKDLLQSFQQRVEGFGTDRPENQRGEARREIQQLQRDQVVLEERLRDVGFDIGQNLALRLRLLLNANEQQTLSRDLALDEARAVRETAQARRDAAEQALASQRSLGAAELAAADQLARARSDQAQARGQATFGAKPAEGTLEEQRFFDQRIELAKAATAAEVGLLVAERQLASQRKAEGEAAVIARQAEVDRLSAAIELREREGAQRVAEISQQQTLLRLQRDREAADALHATRVRDAGGGNLLGQNPAAVISVALPTSADIDKLRVALAGIPPIGLPTAADFEAARRAATPTVLQGARQQGLESGEGDAIQDAVKDAKSLAEAMRDVRLNIASSAAAALGLDRGLANALTSGLGLVDALGGIQQANEDIKNATTSAEKLAGELDKISAIGSAIGAGIALIGAGIGFLGSLGKDARQEESDRIIAQNNERLAQLSLDLRNADLGARALTLTAAQIQEVRAEGLTGDPRIAGAPGKTNDRLEREQREALQQHLDAAGLTVEQWALRIEQLTGLDVLDSKGRIVAGTLAQATIALDALIESATHFGKGISDIEAQERTRDALGLSGRSDDPEIAAMERARDIILKGLELSPQEEARAAGFDLSTEEGRELLLAWERDLFKRAEAGQLTPEELGAFGDVDELVRSIGDSAEGVSAFDKAIKEATGSLGDFNLPPGFKRELFAFEASPFGPPWTHEGWDWRTRAPVPLGPEAFHPWDGAALPLPRTEATMQVGSITINVYGGGDPELTADAVMQKIRQASLILYGSTGIITGEGS